MARKELMKIDYLTTGEIIEIHDDIIKTTGGNSGIINYGNIDFVSSQMRVTKGFIRKAAVLLYGILTGHPFLDGNKRTGFRSVESFLNANNKRLLATDEEIWDVVHNVSKGKMKLEDVVEWIKRAVK